ncbi:hypothetical protein [Streptomyces sp. NPDC020298]|uniref:hypothetical protein n=1 Tax=unclassified Streptomyces TaxID=2593676 RepID=UPI0034086DB1
MNHTDPTADFDGCYRECRIKQKHTLAWGLCEHAAPPEPTVSMSRVYTDPEDGYPSIGYDSYTVPQLARLIEPALGDPLKAAAAARAIVHRNDAPADEPVCPTCQHAAHRPGVECDGVVDHGPKRWHRCLCINLVDADRACPPQLDCQGGTLGYSDVWFLQRGQSLQGADGRVITPHVLKAASAAVSPPTDPTAAVWADGDPLTEAIAHAVWKQCGTDDCMSLTVDDPRNIAAVAAAVARAAVPAGQPTRADDKPPQMNRAAKAEALLLRFAAEAHRRKWAYDRGLDDDGVPLKSEAFDALHRLGDEMRVALDELRHATAAAPAVVSPPTSRAAVRAEAFAEAAEAVRGMDTDPGTQFAADQLSVMADRERRLAGEAHDTGTQQQDVTEAAAELTMARATNQRLNRRAQALESELAAYRRAVGQWEVSERGTYIPHSSLRVIGKACGVDILGSVRHLKHFERVEQAEAAIERARAAVHIADDEDVTDARPGTTAYTLQQRQQAAAQQQSAPEAWVCKCPVELCGCGHHGEQLPAAADSEEPRP